VSLQVGPESD
jgi:hypothetical protein